MQIRKKIPNEPITFQYEIGSGDLSIKIASERLKFFIEFKCNGLNDLMDHKIEQLRNKFLCDGLMQITPSETIGDLLTHIRRVNGVENVDYPKHSNIIPEIEVLIDPKISVLLHAQLVQDIKTVISNTVPTEVKGRQYLLKIVHNPESANTFRTTQRETF